MTPNQFTPSDGGTETSDRSKFILSEGMYKVLKQLVQVILPAVGTGYFAMASIWGFPEPEKVLGTITVLTTFLGVTLGISVKNYKASGAGVDGDLVVKTAPSGRPLFSFDFNGEPEELAAKDCVTFNVTHPEENPDPEDDPDAAPTHI